MFVVAVLTDALARPAVAHRHRRTVPHQHGRDSHHRLPDHQRVLVLRQLSASVREGGARLTCHLARCMLYRCISPRGGEGDLLDDRRLRLQGELVLSQQLERLCVDCDVRVASFSSP